MLYFSAFIQLLKRNYNATHIIITIMNNKLTILDWHSDSKTCAYLSTIVSIATADWKASDEDLQCFTTLCEGTFLSLSAV